MKLNPRRIAPFGLYLALLAVIVSIGLYIVQQQFDLALKVSLGIIIIGLAIFAIFDPQRVFAKLSPAGSVMAAIP